MPAFTALRVPAYRRLLLMLLVIEIGLFAFENALFKLRDYGEKKDADDKYEEVESNFTIAYLMLARCWQRLGDEEKADKLFARVKSLRPDLAPLADEKRNAESNVLLIVDFGDGPQKVLEGDNSLVAFRPTPEMVGPLPAARVKVATVLLAALLPLTEKVTAAGAVGALQV